MKLSESDWKKFMEAIERPPRPNKALRELFMKEDPEIQESEKDHDLIISIRTLAELYPNDFDLGGKVRQLLNENFHRL